MHEATWADLFPLRQDLSSDVIDPGHILTVQATEIVAQTGTGTGMLMIILDQMADIHDVMRAAPVT